MPMKMGWRWYGEGNDPISLSDIKQIPGVTSIVWALHDKMPGEIWEIDEIQKVADQIHAHGFDMDVVESVNVHDDIKIGLPIFIGIGKSSCFIFSALHFPRSRVPRSCTYILVYQLRFFNGRFAGF